MDDGRRGQGEGDDGGDERPPDRFDRPAEPASPSGPGAGAGSPSAAAEPAPPADHWIRPAAGPAAPLPPPRGTLRVVSVITRSIDLFLQRPVPFLTLALPAAIVSGLGSVLYLLGGGPQAYTPGTVPTIGLAAALGIVVGVVAVVLGIALTLAMTMAADDVRAGRTVDIRSRFGQGLRRTGYAILSGIAEILLLLVTFIGGAIVVVPLALTRSVPLVVIGFLVLMIAFMWLVLRLAFSTTAIALEPVGPIQALSRSWGVTRGNLWRIVAVLFVMGLLTVPLAFGIGLLSLALNEVPIITLVLSTFASLVTVPLFSIVSTMMFADLTGRPEAPRAHADSTLRLTFVGGIVVVGVIALAVAIPRAPAAFERLALQAIPAQTRGVIVASNVRNPFDPCQPLPTRGSLPSTVPIYIGGYFTRPIPAGRSGTVEVYLDGLLVNSEPLGDPSRAVSCYYELEPLVDAQVGTWRITVILDGERIASGEFVVR